MHTLETIKSVAKFKISERRIRKRDGERENELKKKKHLNATKHKPVQAVSHVNTRNKWTKSQHNGIGETKTHVASVER